MKLRTAITTALLGSTSVAGMAFSQTELTMWYHGGGNEVESNILNSIVEDFNTGQADWMG